jgi:nucleoside-diphosphate-sugar epimerase
VRIVHDIGKLPPADVFYHLAWEQASGPGRGDAVLQSRNVSLTLKALNAAHSVGAKFVALGTVYEHFAESVVRSGKSGGSDFYVLAKNSAFAMSNQLAYKLNADFVWCRICHPIGRYIKPEQLMAYTVSSLISGNAPSFGPSATLYDIVAVEDVAKGLCLIGKQEAPRREYYIGSGTPMILREYFEMTKRILSVDTPLLIGQRPDDGLSFQKGWFDISPLSEDTGYSPSIGFKQAVRNVADWIGAI